jgi:hypothetical protein
MRLPVWQVLSNRDDGVHSQDLPRPLLVSVRGEGVLMGKTADPHRDASARNHRASTNRRPRVRLPTAITWMSRAVRRAWAARSEPDRPSIAPRRRPQTAGAEVWQARP